MQRSLAHSHSSLVTLVFRSVWFLVGVLALIQGWTRMLGMPEGGARDSYGLVAVFGLLAVATSATCGMRGKAFCFVGGATGAILGLYGIALILLGSEDVGGLRVSLPFGSAAIVLGGWTLIRVWNRAWEAPVKVA